MLAALTVAKSAPSASHVDWFIGRALYQPPHRSTRLAVRLAVGLQVAETSQVLRLWLCEAQVKLWYNFLLAVCCHPL